MPCNSGTDRDPSQSAAARDGLRTTVPSDFISRTRRFHAQRQRAISARPQLPGLPRVTTNAIRMSAPATAPTTHKLFPAALTGCFQSILSRTLLSTAGLIRTAPATSMMCVTRPASEFSPTDPTAAPRLSPCRWRKRTLTAMPPEPAGSRWLANDAATCTANTRLTGGNPGIEPNWVTVPATQIATVATTARMSHCVSAPARLAPPARTVSRFMRPRMITAVVTPMASRI
ncbi:MAG: hypothetical protein QOE54_5958 [Streptosporangiaceae bacterium]|nr:hypothetical protein [Streptosporangiaceae bacterium]